MTPVIVLNVNIVNLLLQYCSIKI